ncbi:hypothetical protein B0T10DRAFT_531651 [Thelonectria olida]|uniref:Chromo domain-containing protein n=1 Tax=Thelonectria olida TaxID=1576542 RepID=A0A9P8VXK5_9HYPO|nr:hypothetical protein B0T10DRAFT_531651 [Thelonectria olida]
MLHWLANIISAKAFSGSSTVDQVLSIRLPRDGNFRILEWADNVRDQPLGIHSWGKQASDWAMRSGFTIGFGLHAVRREALIKANDNGYSLGQVLRFASQNNTNVLVNHYLGSISTIDGAGSFLGMELRSDLAEDFRSATMRRNPDLQRIFKPRLANLKAQRKTAYEERRTLEREKLQEFQQSQRLVYENHLGEHEQGNWRRTYFNRIRHVLPKEQLRLGQTLSLRLWPRSPEWISALEDLIALRTKDHRVAYQDALQPINGRCPVPDFQTCWKHIYRCYEAFHKKLSGFARFCFICSKWWTSKSDWLNDSQSHIDSCNVPFRCDPVTFRHATACAGYCPAHLGRADLPQMNACNSGQIRPPGNDTSPKPELEVVPTEMPAESPILTAKFLSTNEGEYLIDCLLGRWGKDLFFLRWQDGSYGWEPRDNILDDDLIEKFETEYQGFQHGVEVLRTRIRNGKVEYRLHWIGRPTSEDWWVPEKEMSPQEASWVFSVRI